MGGLRLQELDAGRLNHLYAKLLGDVWCDGRGGLSARTLRCLHTIVRSALDDAVSWGRVPFNAAARATPPSASSAKAPEMRTWDASTLGTFLEATVPSRNGAAFLTLAMTGARRGEVLGLRWQDIELDTATATVVQQITVIANKVHVERSTKGDRVRVIELDEPTVAALRTWRARLAEERLALGAGFTDHGLVFAKPTGEPLHPERFSREFDRWIGRLGLPRIRLHDLRHTWATLALQAGIDVKVVSERLGLSSAVITRRWRARHDPRTSPGSAWPSVLGVSPQQLRDVEIA